MGTRGSQLALAQTRKVEDFLREKGFQPERVVIKSEGDLNRSDPLWKMGGKGAFTRTLEKALLDGTIDVAVHSAKDLPVTIARGTWIAGVLPRGSAEDILIVRDRVDDLQLFLSRSTVATGSLRRKAFLKRFFGVEKFVQVRGNIDTRIRKLFDGEYDALVLARAGIERIGLLGTLRWYKFDEEFFIPATNQGFIVVQAREGEMEGIFHFEEEAECFRIERAIARLLQLDCRTPAAFYCSRKNGVRKFIGEVITPDGDEWVDVRLTGEDPEEEFVRHIYDLFVERGVEEILKRIKEWQEKL